MESARVNSVAAIVAVELAARRAVHIFLSTLENLKIHLLDL